jgi:hypothetical protein
MGLRAKMEYVSSNTTGAYPLRCRSGWMDRFVACAGDLALAMSVDKTGAGRRARLPVCDDVSDDRFASGVMPLLPFVGTVWFPFGVQELSPLTKRAAAVLRL